MQRSIPFLWTLPLLVAACGGREEAPAPSPGRLAEAPVPDWPAPSQAQEAAAARLKVPVRYEEPTTGIRFLLVPGGTFRMGSPETEPGRDEDEGPVREVELSPFYLAMFETTNAQYRKFKADHRSGEGFDGDTQPVVRVSQADAKAFNAWLTSKDPAGTQGAPYLLPTEAQWEYACRAGTTTPFAFGPTLDAGDANFSGAVGRTAPIGRYAPNAWGFYDMHGNVWEWCQDSYGKDFYAQPEAKRKDPRNANAKAVGRITRGGGWAFPADGVRSAYRRRTAAAHRGSAFGFRVARAVPAD
jgi:formylglycine-generating enzyme required for sulfatase activity